MQKRFRLFPSNQSPIFLGYCSHAAKRAVQRGIRTRFAATTIRDNQELDMATNTKTVIVTGASQGIGAAGATVFLERGHNVVATSRNISKVSTLKPSDRLAFVDGDIAHPSTPKKAAETAISRFASIGPIVHKPGMSRE